MSSAPLRLMAVHAHPDDEASKGAAATAMYAARGVQVLVVLCTGGERGDILNPALAEDPDLKRDLAEYRRQEMARSAQALGVDYTWLGFVDSGLPEGDPKPPLPEGCFALEPVHVAAESLVRLVREFRPHVMTTYDENGGYPHPDHIMCHKVSVAAFDAAADARQYPHAGPPWQVQKLYYNSGFSAQRLRAVHEALLAEGHDSPFGEWLERTEQRGQRPITTRVRCPEYFPARDEALRAHATQVDPNGVFFAVPRDLERRVWPTDDYELARSLVDVELPEDDLFTGIRLEGTT